MKNVIVFALGPDRYAVELRWVRDVFTLGHVTPVPHAPAALAGVVNYRGAIMPVLDVEALLDGERPSRGAAHAGQGAILIQDEDLAAALRVTSVFEVATLHLRLPKDAGMLLDSTGKRTPLLDPPTLLVRALGAAQAAASALPGVRRE
jgi:chemotaxis signal transduction protein